MKLIEIAQEQYRIFVDMDGVLTDFQKKMSEIIGEPHDESRYDADPQYRKRMWKAFADYQKQGGEVWYELDFLPDANQLLKFIQRHQPEILSAAGASKHKGKDQKERWVRENIPFPIKTNIVPSAADKRQFAGPKHILIDDKEKALGPWRAAGGIGILHTSAVSTIKQLQELGL